MKYLYYTLYRLLLKVKTNNTPKLSAMLLITMFEFANITTVLTFFPKTWQVIYETKNQVIWAATMISVTLIAINYLVLIKNTEKLCAKYKTETSRQKISGVLLLVIYVTLSAFTVYYFNN